MAGNEAMRNIVRKKHFDAGRALLICISVLFIGSMLVLPLGTVIYNALRNGWKVLFSAWRAPYTISALKVTLYVALVSLCVNTVFGIAAAWCLTKYDFRGKQILSSMIDIPFSCSPVIVALGYIMMFGRMGWAAPMIDWIYKATGFKIQLPYSINGVILATIFVTFPFVVREIVPVLNAIGKEEETAAAQMGAGGAAIFFKITMPNMKWALLSGMSMCTARALGEFGAVFALARSRGETFTLPLEVDALYMTGRKDSVAMAFAAAFLLILLDVTILAVKNIAEYITKKKKVDEAVE